MKIFNRQVARVLLLLPIITGISCSRTQKISQQKFQNIQAGFTTPQDSNKVWCYYYWIGDDISKEGVTKDLEAMKEFGIGTVLVGNINPEEIDGKVPLFSEEWWEITTHTVNEGAPPGNRRRIF